MGIDTCICFKAVGDTTDTWFGMPQGCTLRPEVSGDEKEVGATHQLDNPWRFYGEDYERGPWPSIAAALMTLMACPGIEKIWYYGDCDDQPVELTETRLIRLTRHYILNGNRPYDVDRSLRINVS